MLQRIVSISVLPVLSLLLGGCGPGIMYDTGRDPVVKHLRTTKGAKKCKAGKRTYHVFFVVEAGGDEGLEEVMEDLFKKVKKIELDEKTKVGDTEYRLVGYEFISDECAWKIQQMLESVDRPRITYRGTMLFFDTLAINVEGTAEIHVSGTATPGARVFLINADGDPVEFSTDGQGNFQGPISVARGQEYIEGWAEYESEAGETVKEEMQLAIFQ